MDDMVVLPDVPRVEFYGAMAGSMERREGDLKYRLAFDTMPDCYAKPCRVGAYRETTEE
jgi:hypothetical protein